MVGLWKNRIRSLLRDQPFNDLHDYYDFHLHIDNRIRAIINSILDGTYQPSRPIRVKSEKKFGITRQLVVLYPDDALVLEVVGDFLAKIVNDAQPSKKAFFSRNHVQPKSIADFDKNFGYPWWILWPEFQKEIMEFTQKRKYTVVTDVANYYDSIDFCQLRNFLASLGPVSEAFLDFLFFLLERFVWRPDYLPFPGRGLPQINLDAPRLVAHAFLFEVDSLISELTNNDFVRWMDDINFGCDEYFDAQKLINSIDDLLLSRGLHLNPSKTQILKSKEAYEYFQIRENLFLNMIEKVITSFDSSGRVHSDPKYRKVKWMFHKRLQKFLEKEHVGVWNKVLKRYFNISGKFLSAEMVPLVPELLIIQPDLRETIFRYFVLLGWSDLRERMVVEYLSNSVDDSNFMKAINVLLEWNPEPIVQYIIRMKNLARTLIEKKDSTSFIGGLWLISKFGNDDEIDRFLKSTLHFWMSNDWLARQVAALWPRIRNLETKTNIKAKIHSFGLKSANLVIDNYDYIISNEEVFQKQSSYYIYALSKNKGYSLPKLLISLSVINSDLDVNTRVQCQQKLISIVKDPVFRYLLKREKIN